MMLCFTTCCNVQLASAFFVAKIRSTNPPQQGLSTCHGDRDRSVHVSALNGQTDRPCIKDHKLLHKQSSNGCFPCSSSILMGFSLHKPCIWGYPHGYGNPQMTSDGLVRLADRPAEVHAERLKKCSRPRLARFGGAAGNDTMVWVEVPTHKNGGCGSVRTAIYDILISDILLLTLSLSLSLAPNLCIIICIYVYHP